MTVETRCVVCGQAMADQAYACQHCGITRPTAQLQAIADMTPAARDVAHGVSRRGGASGSTGKPGSRLPLDLGATSKLGAVQASLTTWARHVAEERSGALWVSMTPELIVEATRYLTGNLEWFRHRPEVDEFLRDVTAAARIVASVARGPVAQRYLGPCGAQIPTAVGVDGFVLLSRDCDGDVYACEGASNGSCRVCSARVSTGERQAWLDDLVRSQAFHLTEIADAYPINIKTLRSWATDRPEQRDHRGRLVRSATPARLHVHGRDLDGKPLYLLGDVLDLAAADAARRAGEQAKRARRAESETAA